MRTRETSKRSGPRLKRKLNEPSMLNPDDYKEIKRLMKMPIPDEFPITDEHLCPVCNLEPHGPHSCPWMKELPAGAVPGPSYDAVCLGCGKIGGETCCPGYAAYAVRKSCFICPQPGHWFWEDRCSDKYKTRRCYQMCMAIKQALVETPSPELENNVESAASLNFCKQIKNKDVVMVGIEDADKDAAQLKVADKPEPSDLSERPKMVEYTVMVPNYVSYNHPKYVVPDILVRLFKEQNMVHLKSMDLKDRKHSDMVRDDNQLVS